VPRTSSRSPPPWSSSPPGSAQAGTSVRIQECVSGALPRWMSVSIVRRRRPTGPGWPSPITTSPPWWRTRPIGVTTAAVPQPKTSVIRRASGARGRGSRRRHPRRGPWRRPASLRAAGRHLRAGRGPVEGGARTSQTRRHVAEAAAAFPVSSGPADGAGDRHGLVRPHCRPLTCLAARLHPRVADRLEVEVVRPNGCSSPSVRVRAACQPGRLPRAPRTTRPPHGCPRGKTRR
jgi:hypothetical protein